MPMFLRVMNKTFGDQIRNIVEVYVDDIMAKIKEGSTLVEDLTLVFDRLHSTRISCSVSWFHTGALRQTQLRSGQSRQ